MQKLNCGHLESPREAEIQREERRKVTSPSFSRSVLQLILINYDKVLRDRIGSGPSCSQASESRKVIGLAIVHSL